MPCYNTAIAKTKVKTKQQTAIVDLIQSKGGVMTLDDLASCEAEIIQPIKYDFRVGQAGDEGVTLWEVGGVAPFKLFETANVLRIALNEISVPPMVKA